MNTSQLAITVKDEERCKKLMNVNILLMLNYNERDEIMKLLRLFIIGFYSTILLALVASCSSKDIVLSFVNTEADKVQILYNDTLPIVVHINDTDSIIVNSNDSFNVKDLMEFSDCSRKYEAVYEFCKKGYYPLRIVAKSQDGVLLADTLLKVIFPSMKGKVMKEVTTLNKGNLCPYILQNSYNGDRKKLIIGWMLDNGYALDSTLIAKMEEPSNYLCGIEYPIYVLSTNSAVPRYSELQNSTINVMSDLHAERYFLLAAGRTSALYEEIRKIIIDQNIKGLPNNNGLITGTPINVGPFGNIVSIFLVGINSNGKYFIQPVGAYIIDKVKPILEKKDVGFNPYGTYNLSDQINDIVQVNFDFREIGFVVSYKLRLRTSGIVTLSYGNFEGNSVMGHDIPFTLDSYGDIKTIEITRTKGNEWGIRPGKKIINVNGETLNDYHFDFNLLLRIGDNYIPIVLTDMRGNKTKVNFYIPISRVVVNRNANDDIEDLQSEYDELEERISQLENTE